MTSSAASWAYLNIWWTGTLLPDNEFAIWDYTNGLYSRIGYSKRMGTDGTTDLATLNSTFDTVYNNGGIYHLMIHPSYADWSSGSYADQHTTYISGKKDIWYVGMGYLYLYNYTREKAAQKLAAFGSSLYLYYGKSNDTSTSNYNTTFTKDFNRKNSSELCSGVFMKEEFEKRSVSSKIIIPYGYLVSSAAGSLPKPIIWYNTAI